MALKEKILEKYQYLTSWYVRINIIDDVTNKIYHHEIAFDHDPTTIDIDTEIAKVKTRVQAEIDYDANDMNLPTDEEEAVEYLRDIKADVIKRIRQYPAATKKQAIDYINSKYTDSLIDAAKLLDWYANYLGLATWDEFKTFVINKKFKDID